MSEKFSLEGHLYYSTGSHFFRDKAEITLAEFYNAFIQRLRGSW